MLPFINKYSYKELERNTSEDGFRVYVTPDGEALPSVTTILKETQDHSAIDAWRKRIGAEAADIQTAAASNVGSLMHENLENWIQGKPPIKGNGYLHKNALLMANNIINNGLDKSVTGYYGMEKHLYYPGLYAGTVDLVAATTFGDTIVDYKNSKQIKKEEWMSGYFMQLSAYRLAHNHQFGSNINRVSVMMTERAELNPHPQFKEFILEGEKLKKYTNIWLETLDTYYTKKEA